MRAAGGVALHGTAFEQVGALGLAEPGSVLERQPVVRDGFPVCPAASSLPRRRRGMPDEGVHVAGQRRVVHQPRRVGVRVAAQHTENTRLQGDPARPRQRVEDRTPGELVAEHGARGRDRHQPPLLGSGERREAVGQELLDQPALGRRREHRELLDRVPVGVVQRAHLRGDSIDNGQRYDVEGAGGEQLVDVVRVPGGQRVHAGVGQPRTGTQLGHRRRGQRGKREPAHPRAAGRQAQQPAQGVVPRHLAVAVGEQEDDGELRDAPHEVMEQVERRVVGPVHVLHRQHRGPSRPVELGPELTQQALVVGPCDQCRPQPRPDRAAQVAERAERPWRRQVVTVADQQPTLRRQLGPGGRDESRLADPGLT